MARGMLLHWSVIAGLLAGSFINICLFNAGETLARAKGAPHETMLMAAVEPAQIKPPLPSVQQQQLLSEEPIRVPLEQDDRALLLEATLNDHTPTRLILDTGATYTSISRELAESLGYDLEHAARIKITTANGQVLLPKIVLKSVTLNGYTAHNVEATVMNMPGNVPFSGLLGLNFVKRHRITIDAQAEHLVIEPHGL
jgi:clan AA aspartic protease (TIGR02281 family)